MGIVCLVLCILVSLLRPLQCGAEATDSDERAMVERINERYDDFFRRQSELDELNAKREREAQEIKKVRSEHEKEVEEARRLYVLSRRKAVEDPRLEQQWEEQQKQAKQEMDQDRRRYVKEKKTVEDIVRRGRHIDENKEYDIED
jgi:hypothetical protein